MKKPALVTFLLGVLTACAAPTQGNPPPMKEGSKTSAKVRSDDPKADQDCESDPSAAGCPSADAGPRGNAGAPSAGAGGGEMMTDAAVSQAGGDAAVCDLPEENPEYFCDPNGDGACQNCSDCQKVESGEAKEAAKTCGTDCGTDRDCATRCVQESIGASDGCTSCLVDLYDCLLSTCLVECVGSAEQCSACSADKQGSDGMTCSGKWFACSGTERNPNF